jgi:hypothetical protein
VGSTVSAEMSIFDSKPAAPPSLIFRTHPFVVRLFLEGTAAVVLIAYGVGIIYYLRSTFFTGWLPFGIMLIVLPAILEFHTRLRRLAKRYQAVQAQEQQSNDPRPPVLYLGSFALQLPNNYARASQMSDQEYFYLALKEFGPGIAVGEPGESLPPFLAARRMYFQNDTWLEEVKRLLRKAQLVIMHPGNTPNLALELENIKKTCAPEKLLFPLLFNRPLSTSLMDAVAKNRDWQALRKSLEPALNVSLPENIDSGILLYFEPDWSPKIATSDHRFEMYSGPLRRIFGDGTVVVIKDALTPILRNRGLKGNRFRIIGDQILAFARQLPWYLFYLFVGIGNPLIKQLLMTASQTGRH